MIRTQIQLDEDLWRALKGLSAAQGISLSEVVRRALIAHVKEQSKDSREEMYRRAASVAGAFRSGCSDVSERHDDHLAEAFWE